MRFPALFLFLLLSLGCEPIVMIPGGELSGEVVPIPADWKFTDAIDTVQLETRPDDPYSVNIWAVAVGDGLYFATSDTEWSGYIASDPRVRLRADGKIYEMRAAPTDDPEERAAALAALMKKYDFEPDPEQTSSSTLYRLETR